MSWTETRCRWLIEQHSGASRAEEADALLYLLLSKACDALGVPTEGVALVAVGGYGREELSPYSDLDVMLLHVDGYPQMDELAAQIWYPLWDSRTKLDHSVRTVAEARRPRRTTYGSRWGCWTRGMWRGTRISRCSCGPC